MSSQVRRGRSRGLVVATHDSSTDTTGSSSDNNIQSQQGSQNHGSSGGQNQNQEFATVEDMNNYGDVHRYMLQGMIYAGILDAKGVKRLFTGACNEVKIKLKEAELKMPFIQRVVTKINERIKSFNMSIKTVTCEITETRYYAFVMLISSPMVQFQRKISKMETEMFQLCMEAILRKSETFSLSETECHQIARLADPKKTVATEVFLEKMLGMLYFTKCPNIRKNHPDQITLGPKAIREFDCILQESYTDVVVKCSLCKNNLLHGLKCPNAPKCSYVMHRFCYTKFVTSCQECVECKASWDPSSMLTRVRDLEAVDTDVEAASEDDDTQESSLVEPAPPTNAFSSLAISPENDTAQNDGDSSSSTAEAIVHSKKAKKTSKSKAVPKRKRIMSASSSSED